MRKEIKSTDYQPQLKVVEAGNQHPGQIEREIERHIKSLTSLIQKLHPTERRQYFSGLLSHLLNEPVETGMKVERISSDKDLSCLPAENLLLIRELSLKLNELYCITGDTE